MPRLVAKRRRFAVLAVLAVVASLLVVPVSPAGATNGTADKKATFSACPTGVAPAAGFTDVGAGSFAAAAIDCVKYYGVTQGTSATTYSPASVVTREQMALFLIRAAGPAGITVPAAASQGFTDIAGLPQASQDAINQLKALGITTGTSATTYSPAGTVSRVNMAQFLARFLNLAIQGPGGGGKPNSFAGDDTQFTDLGAVSVDGFNAVYDLFELGVTTGTSTTTFSPFDAVTREQMAAFIARTLNHTNARPKGVNIQAVPASGFGNVNANVSISHRDDTFKPVPNTLVDVFALTYNTGTTLTPPLNADGTCNTGATGFSSVTGGACTINLTDAATDSNGNIAVAPVVPSGKTVTWWAWTGATGATFDLDTTKVSSATTASTADATQWIVTTTIPDNATLWLGGNQVKYGTAVTHTFQLADASGASVAKAGVTMKWLVQTVVNGVLDSAATVSGTTDSSGKVSFTLTNADPAAVTAGDGDETTAAFSVVDIGGLGLDLTAVPNGDPDITWNDDTSAAATVKLSQTAKYTLASDAGSGATNSVNATVTDQYGLGMSGRTVAFTSSDAAGIGAVAINRVTNSSGVATLGYSRDSLVQGIESIDADDVAAAIDATNVDHYWALEVPNNFSGAALVVNVLDGANDAIVLTAGGVPWIAYYDSNDQVKLAGVAKSYADFDKAVTDDTSPSNITLVSYQDAASGISQLDYAG